MMELKIENMIIEVDYELIDVIGVEYDFTFRRLVS
jgi:hypothetical protein